MTAFVNQGLIDLHALTTFGVCAKETTNPIGYFGTGLKYAIAVLLREKCEVELWRGTKRHIFTAKKRKFRNVEVEQVFMDDTALPYTTELGKNWELWMAYRELAANAYDENGYVLDESGAEEPQDGWTVFVVVGAEFEKIREEQIFLATTPRYELEGLQIHDSIGGGNWVYFKGIRAYKLPKQSLFGYNVLKGLTLTEDRTVSAVSDIYIAIAKAIAKCDNAALIRQLLTADERYWESTIDYNWWHVKPGEVFNKVVSQLIDRRTAFNSSARSRYRYYHPEDDLPNVIDPMRIPIEQRRRLWAALTFWEKLGFDIPKAIVKVTDSLGTKKGKVVGGVIYISKFVLEMDMRYITGLVYKFYAETKPTIGNVKQEDLLIDTIVDFGERLLGVQKRGAA